MNMKDFLPKVSVMIITYNQEDLIAETIESVISQDYENLEIIVADDASTDRTVEIISDYVKRYIAWGAGPRATQHLVTASKASALLDGRPTPEVSDLKRMAIPVLRHRIVANYNALGEGIESDAIVQHLVESAVK